MPSRSLPTRPNLKQLKLQANELLRSYRKGSLSAASRIVAHHPRMRDRPLPMDSDRPLALADAQLVIAREYGFDNWARLKHHVDTEGRVASFQPHPRFDEAVAAIDGGDLERLRRLIAAEPDLVPRGRTSSRLTATSAARHFFITLRGTLTVAGKRAIWARCPRTSSTSPDC